MKQAFFSVLVVVGISVVGGLGGCASTRSFHDAPGGQAGEQADSESGRVVLEGVSYREAFEAVREVLGAYRFAINRVDATRGVISTFPKRTLGIGSIWDREQSSLGQEWEDFANQHERTIRVEFERAGQESDADAGGGGAVVVVVEVVVHRVHRPNWRVESESIGLSTYAHSRDAMGRVEPREFREPIGRDLDLAQRIARRIASRLE